ncbi:tRNA (adenosine(37)-N6)-threonylcarbamoyltransferase complex dimerization subunit type 1 TsaB [Ramlibacter sp. PS4R-6]|uniref:tRNA (adenosine(37)-N6)-threonylcarbamoyltransferase complex dimerization subunit type 1 TsaB n=1 Tax=Ramlibacter sp. PS4R-6 TaxID=3133438 RepID=UPI00309D0394
MNLLAFDTSTETLAAAVMRGGAVVAEERTVGGAQASAALIPALQALLAQAGLALGDLDAIVFGRGPGSFTGLRTACAVAQGLGFGSGVPVLGIETLLAVAEDARERAGATQVVAMLDARMSEVYAARYAFGGGEWRREGDIVLARPETVEVPAGWRVAGNVFDAARIEAQPTAAAMLRIAPRLLAKGAAQDAAHAAPVYIRDKVAQTTEERAQARANRPPPP